MKSTLLRKTCNVFLSLVACSALITPSLQGIHPDDITTREQIEEHAERFSRSYYIPFKVGIAKTGIHSAGEIYRYLHMGGTNAEAIKEAATVTKITSLLTALVGLYKMYTYNTRLVKNERNKREYLKCFLWSAFVDGGLLAIPHIFDFFRSHYITRNAKQIARGNQEKRYSSNPYHPLLCLFTLEAAINFYPDIKSLTMSDEYPKDLIRAYHEERKTKARNRVSTKESTITFCPNQHSERANTRRRRERAKERLEAIDEVQKAELNFRNTEDALMGQEVNPLLASLVSAGFWLVRYIIEGSVLKELTKEHDEFPETDDEFETDDEEAFENEILEKEDFFETTQEEEIGDDRKQNNA